MLVHEDYPWGDDRHPRTPWDETIIYELHVRGFTNDPSRRARRTLRGTYAGLAHPAVIDYLTGLGVTAVELLPIQHFVSEPGAAGPRPDQLLGLQHARLLRPARGATRAAPGSQVREFKAMVRALHEAGIEVILDVVYNHTPEGPPDGPMLSFRGIDNYFYYRPDDRRPGPLRRLHRLRQHLRHPRARSSCSSIMDSLRYWITEMHVDGFRFDLAPALARSAPDVDTQSPFLDTIHQDPLISQVKLIAEPWDVGAGGYQVGQFPAPWTEWNGRYRDTVRGFWSHGAGGVRDLAYRLSGSSDLYAGDDRSPFASINFVTAHDGFCLRDLVYLRAQAQRGQRREQPRRHRRQPLATTAASRARPTTPPSSRCGSARSRNLLTTLVLSAGAPMLVAGDERWRTQRRQQQPVRAGQRRSRGSTGPPSAEADACCTR